MPTGREFVPQLETAMERFVGRLVARSILTRQLKNINRGTGTLSAADCKVLTQNVIKAVSLFSTKEEAGSVQRDLNNEFKSHFPLYR
jgi:hypothetical protein